MQEEDKFDGELENDLREPTKRRVHVKVTERFIDHHISQYYQEHPGETVVKEKHLSPKAHTSQGCHGTVSCQKDNAYAPASHAKAVIK
eukprot:5113266-Karenia_brevis.AAC.1